MIEYNAIALCCCYAKSALSTETRHQAQLLQPTDHRNTAYTASKTLAATSSSVLKKLKRSERISTVYKPMFHAMSTGSLQGRLTLDAFIFKYLKNNPLFSIFSLNKHQSLNSDQFKPVSFISEKVILTLFWA